MDTQSADDHTEFASLDLVFRFLDPYELARFADDPRMELSPEFVDRIEGPFDYCYAATLDGKLVGYCFLALNSIEPDQNRPGPPGTGIGFVFRRNVAFRYKGFVHPDYRGQKIYPQLINAMALAMRKRGVRFLFSTTEVSNFAASACFRRLRYKFLGLCAHVGVGSRSWMSSPDLSRYGIELWNETSARESGDDAPRTEIGELIEPAAV